MTSPDFIWVILAAGGSTRLGQPKQLLSLGGKTLIEHQIDTLFATGLPICVMSGATDFNDLIHQQYHHLMLPTAGQKTTPEKPYPALQMIHNKDWQAGMGASVIMAQQSFPSSDIGWVLVDQYAITSKQALDFYRTWQQTQSPVLVSRYDSELGNDHSAWGVPVITHKHLMAQAPIPERGLKPWLLANHQKVKLQFYAWPEASMDIDTPTQWQSIQQQENWHVDP